MKKAFILVDSIGGIQYSIPIDRISLIMDYPKGTATIKLDDPSTEIYCKHTAKELHEQIELKQFSL